MQVVLTDSLISRLSFASKGDRYEVIDRRQPGLIVVVGSRSKVFYWRTRVNYKPIKVNLGQFGTTTTQQARAEVLKLILQSREGVLPPSLRKEKALRVTTPSLQQVFDQYLVMRKLRQTSIDSYKKIARLYLADLMSREVSAITSLDCMKLYQALRDDKSPAKANDAIRLLNALMVYAAAAFDVEVCQVKSKLKAAGLLQPTPARNDLIKDGELTAWFEALMPRPTHYRMMLLTAILTGFRKGELEKLAWDDFSKVEGTLLARDTKNHRDHLLPIGPALTDTLGRYLEQRSRIGLIFGPRIDRWISLSAAKGGVEFSAHTLRRTFASAASKLLGNPTMVKTLLNHSMGNDVTAHNYIRFEREDLRAAMTHIEEFFLSKVDITLFLTELYRAKHKSED
jgi:integrase